MKGYRRVLFAVWFTLIFAGCSPWIKVSPETTVYSFLDVPIADLHKETEKYVGAVFEDRFKFYRIYRSKEDVKVELSKQTVAGKTHFTARPINQYQHAIKIQITPRQDKWLREKGIARQDVVKARVRFAGILTGGAVTFDLLEITGY